VEIYEKSKVESMQFKDAVIGGVGVFIPPHIDHSAQVRLLTLYSAFIFHKRRDPLGVMLRKFGNALHGK
jgi:hypothetical protein